MGRIEFKFVLFLFYPTPLYMNEEGIKVWGRAMLVLTCFMMKWYNLLNRDGISNKRESFGNKHLKLHHSYLCVNISIQ